MHKKWYNQEKKDKYTLFVYTDGSQLDTEEGTATGAGIVIYHENRLVGEQMHLMGPRAEVYDAELRRSEGGDTDSYESLSTYTEDLPLC